MKTLILFVSVLSLLGLTSCGMMQKSEEGIIFKIDTASKLAGRTIDVNAHVENSKEAKEVKAD